MADDLAAPSSLDECINRLGSEKNDEETEWRLTSETFGRLYEEQFPANPDIQNLSAFRSNSQKCLKALGATNGVEEYNKRKNGILQEFTKMDEIIKCDNPSLITRALQVEIQAAARSEAIAIHVSNAANFIIFLGKVGISVRSGSLAIIASTLDSLLDLLSGFILWFTSFSMKKPNPYVYPIGKQRMQPVGILVFSSIMATLGLQIVIMSIERLIGKEKQLELQRSKQYMVVGIMGFVILSKSLLAGYCTTFENKIVLAYAQDHFFDVITNLIGLASAVLASKFYWWIDPAGAILLAIYTMRTWSTVALENVRALLGRTASPEFLQKVTYVCWNHDKSILKIDTVRAYTFGSNYFAEVDIVLPHEIPLYIAHDIGESLQNKLEALPDVERAFVHLDYEDYHKPEHRC